MSSVAAGLRNYGDARDWLYALKNRGSKYGIDRMRALSEALGHPHRAYPIIHLAGTNGKGSTAAMLESIFRTHGYKTGLYTSPHLVRQGERVQVDRRILEEDRIFEYTKELGAVGEKIAESDPELHPSFFEFMTAMAFVHFAREKVDVAIVETGLGGRLDATNVVDPEVSVITSIGLDHCEVLGDSIEAIAREKAGIIKPGRPVVIGALPGAAEAVMRSVSVERGCEIFKMADAMGEDPARYPETSLVGEFQRINAALALTVAGRLKERFSLDLERCASALKQVDWPGRWEKIALDDRLLILDSTHNEEGARWLYRNLEDHSRRAGVKPDIVLGVLGEDRAKAILDAAAPWANSLTLVVPNQPRACSFEQLEAIARERFDGEIFRGTVDSVFPQPGARSIARLAAGRDVVVTGSIYLIGEVKERLSNEPAAERGSLQDSV